MQIAVIGWGSLIWCPGCLRIKSRWRSDGPALPIEFARISGDGRLTLVIHPGSPEEPTPDQRTYWALSELETLDGARENLRVREGERVKLKDIHSLTADDRKEGQIDPPVPAGIGQWLKERQDLGAAIWTGLPTNWPQKRDGKQFTREDAVAYLRKLESEKDQAKAAYDRAREYICNAPSQVQTPVRKMIRERKGWDDAELSKVLFEAGTDDEDS
jgi:hypothetical protein